MLKSGHGGYKFKLFRQSGVESSSTIRFIAVVIATATSRDGDDFFCGDVPNVLVLGRARDDKRRREEGWNMLGYILICYEREKQTITDFLFLLLEV